MADKVPAPVNSARTDLTTFPGARQRGTEYVPLPQESKDGFTTSHAVQTVLVEAQALYELWKDQSHFPLWMEHVVSVTPGEAGKSHWVMGDPDDPDAKRIEFDSEITADIPGRKIAWTSVGGDVEQHGSVEFHTREDGRGTLVTLIQTVKAGGFSSLIASVAERRPRQTVIEDLRHFKQMAESGQIPSVRGQAHGPRGSVGGFKKWLYGETNPTPAGTSSAE